MVSKSDFKKIALSFPEVTEEPHFDKISFRIKKKIFATYDESKNRASLKLSPTNQDIFSTATSAIYPVDNKWGKQGWTYIEMNKADKKLFAEALMEAYCDVAPKKFAEQLKSERETSDTNF